MKKVYKSENSEKVMMELYDKQLAKLDIPYEDLYIDTRFGKTHVIRTGNPDGKPVLLFHGGNSTAPYYLSGFKSLLRTFSVYAADTMGHPGKSAQTILSAKTMDYGLWASDVITGLGFEKMCCMGGSYGGGVLVKLMCVSPEKIEKSVLIVPSGIANVSTANVMFSMGIPMVIYIITKNDRWMIKSVLQMAIKEKNIDEDTFEMVKCSFDNAVVKAGMPSNVPQDVLRKCTAPTLLIAAEKDCLFPGEKVIAKAKEILPNLKPILLKGQGHLCTLPDDVMEEVREFLEN